MIACFTGHRPTKIGGYDETHPLRVRIRAALSTAIDRAIGEGFDTFISGMALGVDTDAAELVLEKGQKLIAAVPFVGQESKWISGIERYRHILSQAEVVIVSPGGYSAQKMQVRNEYMVDRSSLLIAVWDGTSGGTANCVRYAQSKGVRIWRLYRKD
jgi:uncharacterized phage-like protein YoqJ